MKKCLIIGSGIAGLTAASILSSKKIKVTILESSPKFGGRTYSFLDSNSNSVIDNGQHILMGCYKDTLDLIKLIGAEKNFNFQKNLEVYFLTSERKEYKINASSIIYPLNLLGAILNYNILDIMDKINLIGLLLKLPFIRKSSLKNLSVLDWLREQNQNEKIIQALWEILCIGTLNTSPDKASAEVFYQILIKMFYNGNFASTIILPKYGLTESLIDPALSYIKLNSGQVISSETVKEFLIKEEKVGSVISDKNIYEDFDFIILAIPHYAINKIKNSEKIISEIDFSYSTILNIHLWFSEIPLQEKFYGLINSPLHWIFHKESHINVVISDANKFDKVSENELIEMTLNELEKYTPIRKSFLKKHKIIREKRATFIPEDKVLNKRPGVNSNFNNLFLAGDWTNTGLPATIESAAKSGRLAAEKVLSIID
jgi:squalene-associated FAD-dependent desaturase